MEDIILVSHGSPSDPDPQEAFLARVAGTVSKGVPGARVLSATLAAEGALARACAECTRPLIYPWFMTNGWFVSTNLPRRLARAGCADARILPPLGLEPGLTDCAIAALRGCEGKTLILAAHGSPSDPRPRRATYDFAAGLERSGIFAQIRTGFVDEDPTIQAAATDAENGVVLPFFAARAGHVLLDMPEALEAAGFTGAVLDPIGTWDSVADLVARSLSAALRQAA